MTGTLPLTILAMPKPFRGHIGIIQRNAITSWAKLQPRPEIILFGTEVGAAECAAELGLVHIPEVARNQHGTPLLADIFLNAERRASHDLFAYVNADIILQAEFTEAVKKVREAFPRFLAVGRRTNLEFLGTRSASTRAGSKPQRAYTQPRVARNPTAIDCFVFPPGHA
jgi:hypothetical protein